MSRACRAAAVLSVNCAVRKLPHSRETWVTFLWGWCYSLLTLKLHAKRFKLRQVNCWGCFLLSSGSSLEFTDLLERLEGSVLWTVDCGNLNLESVHSSERFFFLRFLSAQWSVCWDRKEANERDCLSSQTATPCELRFTRTQENWLCSATRFALLLLWAWTSDQPSVLLNHCFGIQGWSTPAALWSSV